MSIGQSFVLVTPIQMAALISTVFNGGILYKPQVVLWVGKSGEEKVYEFAPKVQGKLEIRQKHLEIVKEALIGVVNEPHGTGWRARMRDVAVAGNRAYVAARALTRRAKTTMRFVAENSGWHADRTRRSYPTLLVIHVAFEGTIRVNCTRYVKRP